MIQFLKGEIQTQNGEKKNILLDIIIVDFIETVTLGNTPSEKIPELRKTITNLVPCMSARAFTFFSSERMSEETKATEIKYRVDIYIGSDNDSRKIHDRYLDKVRKWANAAFPYSYTLVRGEGYYNGVSEDTILLYAFLNYDVVLKDRLGRLKPELRQESILVVKSPVDFEVV